MMIWIVLAFVGVLVAAGILLKHIHMLAQAKRTVEEMRSEFIALVSFELRTPLFVVQESVDIVFEELKNSLSKEHSALIQTALERLQRLHVLIHDVLDDQQRILKK
jgi:signal transduction histidine kinase